MKQALKTKLHPDLHSSSTTMRVIQITEPLLRVGDTLGEGESDNELNIVLGEELKYQPRYGMLFVNAYIGWI